MNPTFCMGNAAFGFPDEDDAGEDEIHVLVNVPQYVKPYYRTIRKHRKKAFCYGVSSFLLLAGAFCYIFISGECLTTQEKDV
ncbi:snoRNA-binding rRNA-processing protein [Phytophthora oleae]|uniref:SnoRNA-binding rRNA-processing protein n=1 Tax=Phytophthora oleae TaxID=2107226 RepID=A0ABD3FBN4_9STRA